MEIEEDAPKEPLDEQPAAQPNESGAKPGEQTGSDEPTNKPDAGQEIEVPPEGPPETAEVETNATPDDSDTIPDTTSANATSDATPADTIPDDADAAEADAAAEDADATPDATAGDAAGAALDTVPDISAAVPARKTNKYTRWFQALALVLLICVIGGVVLTVHARQGMGGSGTGNVALATPTPIPPLKVTNWCVTQSATVDPQAGQASLDKVVALSSNDVWILGSTDKGNNFNGNTGRSFPLLEHWNGQAWSVVPTADTSSLLKQLSNKVGGGVMSEAVELNDMAVLSDNDIWAVGDASVQKLGTGAFTMPGFPGTGTTINTAGQPLIEHWDGNTWRIVASPGGNSGVAGFSSNALLETISAISANDIWAIGTQPAKVNAPPPGGNGTFTFASFGTVPLVEHWDGKSWTAKPLPASLHENQLLFDNSIQALSANDVWFFSSGGTFGFSGPITVKRYVPATPPPGTTISIVARPGYVKPQGTESSHILNWNGQKWNELKLPDDLSKKVMFQSITAITDNDIWAIGINIDPKDKQNSGNSVIYHWDGDAWSNVASAPGVDPKSSLDGFSVIAPDNTSPNAITPDNIWLTGSTSKHQPLLEHWDGKAWSLVAPTSPAYGSAKSVAAAGKHAWALVDEYKASDAQKAPAYAFPNTIASVVETNC